MRQSLMNTFDEIYILDLHGNTRKREICPDGSEDENVFDIQQGVAIMLMVKLPERNTPAKVFHAELWGERQAKYDALNANDIESTTWDEIEPQSPFYLFKPHDTKLLNEYQNGWKITDIMTVNSVGIVTARDSLTIGWTPEEILERIRDFVALSEQEAREKYNLGKDTRDWKVHLAQADLKQERISNNRVFPLLYRPFDIRYTYYTGRTRGFICMPRPEVMRHMLAGENLGLITARQQSQQSVPWSLIWVANQMVESCVISNKTKEINYLVPLYLYPDPSHPAGRTDEYWPAGKDGRRPNLNPEFVREMERKLGLQFVTDGCGDLKKTFGPQDVFHYMYAVFHSPTYRSRYAEFLKMDFPRVPLTSDVKLFGKLCNLGAELVSLHLLESPALNNPPVRYPVKGDDIVAKGYPKYVPRDAGRVYINPEQYFEPVGQEVWEFHVGGYQVCQKWLKDRRGRKLSYDDIMHYCKIVVALSETIRLMAEIDATIPAWPIE